MLADSGESGVEVAREPEKYQRPIPVQRRAAVDPTMMGLRFTLASGSISWRVYQSAWRFRRV
jgi:hypothetical protein